MAGLRTDDVDRHVGKQIRERRTALGMSQETLARALGVTYQQVHKYEKGANRVACSRLYQIAKALRCEIGVLFPPLDSTGDGALGVEVMKLAAGLSRDSLKALNKIARNYAEQEA